MSAAFRWLLRIFLTLCVLTALTMVFLWTVLSRSLPDYSAEMQVEGISADLEIVRNNANVPHIFGATDEDVYFGLGFAHAQDRLWQMTLLRRTVQGRLSEIFGARTARIDELMRRLDLYDAATRSVAAQDPEVLAALEAYSRGVNAWLAQVNEGALGRGAPEFFLFDPVIPVWQPADSVAILKLMGVQLSSHLENEVLRARMSMLLSPERLRDILPDDEKEAIAALPPYAALFPGMGPDYAALRISEDALSPFPRRAFAGASNAWAAAPRRAAAGGSLLANDPHLGFTAPTVWYLARLELSGGGVIGATIPGMPLVLAGRSEDFGWALTSSYLDDQDLYIEKLNPENPEEYLTPDGWKPFETRRSIVTIKDSAPLTLALRRTENGPVLPGTHYDLASITPPGHVASLAWTLFDREDRSMTAAMKLMQAGTIAEGIAATRDFTAPSQNVTLSDREGVAMITIGKFPARDPAHQTKGRLPSPGWIAENRWQGALPWETNPRFEEPETGIIGNTNNKMIDRPFPQHVSYDWGDTERIRRWQRLMQVRDVHTRESFIEAQLDTVSPVARNLLPLIGAELWFTGEPAPEGTPERRRQQALALLAEWNGEMSEHLPEPLIASMWLRVLQEKLIQDELGPMAAEFTHIEPVFIERVFRNTQGAGVWCDIIQSSPVETCAEISRIALDEAILRLTERYGATVESWRWGDAHMATHDHPTLGQVPVLKFITNIRQSTSGDDFTLMRGRTAGNGVNPFRNVHGAGYRGVYDFADPDSSVFITSTGQSGHPLSRFYDNLGELWRRGEYIPMSLDADLARAAAVGITRLSPR